MAPLRSCFLHFFAGVPNNPSAVRLVLDERGTLQSGLKLDAPGVEFLVGECTPSVGQYVEGKTEVIVGDEKLSIFKRVQVCPYKDTFEYSYDRMMFDYIEPYFNTQQQCNFSTGFDFAYQGRRFNVVAVDPAGTSGVVGKDTVVFFEDYIERKVLKHIQILPYETGLPEKYRPTKLSLDEEGLLRDFVRPYFEQRSSPVKKGDVLEIDGVKFKVLTLTPDPGETGAGVGSGTTFSCKGVALREPRPVRGRPGNASNVVPVAASAAGTDEDSGRGCAIS